MPTTTNFGWTTPADTDLVKDGAAAIRTLGNGIDTSLIDLKGGTTGQILSKASNTDLDYTWINNDQGDITAVTAGTGISGGGTTGAVTITNDMATTITAAGDIVVGTGNATYDNLPIGTTGQVLTADTTVSPYKVKWAAASTGKVVQVVNASTNTETAVLNSTTYTDSTLSATITPTSASNKILVIVNQMGCKKAGTSTGSAVKAQLLRDSTSILVFSQYGGYTNSNLQNEFASMSCNYLDSPATTSATTYKTQIANQTGSNSEAIVQSNSAYSTITLIEVTP